MYQYFFVMRVPCTEPCIPDSIENFNAYSYESNWNSSYYSLDNREQLEPSYFNTYTTLESYQNIPDEDESIIDDLMPVSKIRPALIEKWNSYDIMSWIIELYTNEGFSYEPVNMHLLRNMTGADLLKLPESTFYEIHEKNARWLYYKVKELAAKTKTDSIRMNYDDSHYTSRPFANIEQTYIPETDFEEPLKPKRRGRPRSNNKTRRKSEHKTGKLWEFLRDLLLNPEYCPSLICWENHDEGVFRFVCSDKVAKIWGSKRGNTEMNYEKLSRAMRYYYKNEVLLPVLGKRLVYRFGPKAEGWRTNNPNFEH